MIDLPTRPLHGRDRTFTGGDDIEKRIAELMYTLLLRELGYSKDFDMAELEIELEAEGKLPEFIATCKTLLNKDWETVRAGAQTMC